MSGLSMPVPNDDPACRCVLLDGNTPAPDGFMVIAFGGGGVSGQAAYDRKCPHHGSAMDMLRANTLRGFSIGNA